MLYVEKHTPKKNMSLKYEIYYTLNDYTNAIYYHRHGERHRINGPAYVGENASMFWMQYGRYYSSDGFATTVNNTIFGLRSYINDKG